MRSLLHKTRTIEGPPDQNPLFVRVANRDFLWEQIVDTLDDYFVIRREERWQPLTGNGLLETYPTVGSTVFEPWRRDATPGYERWHNTLQSVRRWARVDLTPAEGGYHIAVQVTKQLEDVDRPEFANVSISGLRHDGTLVRTQASQGAGSVTLGWIDIGRDISLEQQILTELRARVAEPALARPAPRY